MTRCAATSTCRSSRATFAVLDRAGHGVRAEQRTLVGALVGEWLDRLEADRG